MGGVGVGKNSIMEKKRLKEKNTNGVKEYLNICRNAPPPPHVPMPHDYYEMFKVQNNLAPGFMW